MINVQADWWQLTSQFQRHILCKTGWECPTPPWPHQRIADQHWRIWPIHGGRSRQDTSLRLASQTCRCMNQKIRILKNEEETLRLHTSWVTYNCLPGFKEASSMSLSTSVRTISNTPLSPNAPHSVLMMTLKIDSTNAKYCQKISSQNNYKKLEHIDQTGLPAGEHHDRHPMFQHVPVSPYSMHLCQYLQNWIIIWWIYFYNSKVDTKRRGKQESYQESLQSQWNDPRKHMTWDSQQCHSRWPRIQHQYPARNESTIQHWSAIDNTRYICTSLSRPYSQKIKKLFTSLMNEPW